MNHVKDVMLEPNPKTVYGGPILKMEGPLEYMPKQEMLIKRVSSNNTDQCWITGKPQSILSLLCFYKYHLRPLCLMH